MVEVGSITHIRDVKPTKLTATMGPRTEPIRHYYRPCWMESSSAYLLHIGATLLALRVPLDFYVGIWYCGLGQVFLMIMLVLEPSER